jgi:hypothetical protein
MSRSGTYGVELHAVRLVLFRASVAKRDFLLVVDPVLIVRPQTGIQYPLLKAKVALRQVLGKHIAFGRTGVPRQVGDAGDDPGAPVFHDLPGPPSEDLTRQPQVA